MNIIYSPAAIRDLELVKMSIIDKFADGKLAEDIVRSIMKSIRNLEVFPHMGKEVELAKGVVIGYRYLFCKHNYVFYRIEKETIYISRVLNEKQEFMRILFGIIE